MRNVSPSGAIDRKSPLKRTHFWKKL